MCFLVGSTLHNLMALANHAYSCCCSLLFTIIRNLNVAEDDDPGKDVNEDGGDLVSGLHCKIVVQFEKHKDFYNTFKAFCGRSLQKVGRVFFTRV